MQLSRGALSLVTDPAPYRIRAPAIPFAKHTEARGKAKYALIISIDGINYDVLEKHLGKLKHLKDLVDRGFFRPAYTVFPSVTWAAHVSVVTGQYPRHHGVLGNRWWDHRRFVLPYMYSVVETQRRIRTPALYDLTAKRGWTSAAINWPATQRAKGITFNLPETMYSPKYAYRYMSKPLRTVVASVAQRNAEGPRVDITTSVGRILQHENLRADRFSRDIARKLVDGRNTPRLMLVHFVTTDTVQHAGGRTSRYLFGALKRIDSYVGSLINAYGEAGIAERTAFFVVSDHGFLNVSHAVDLRQLLYDKGFNRYRTLRSTRQARREHFLTVFNSQVAYIYARRARDRKRLPELVKLLHHDKYKRCIAGVYAPSEYRKLGLPVPTHARKPRAGTHRSAPSLVVLSKADCDFRNGNPRRRYVYRRHRYAVGSHGYLPSMHKMRAFMIGAGAGLRQRRKIKAARLVDIAPTVAYLMGMSWPKRWAGWGKQRLRLDGRVMTDVLDD
ncbi:MAG: alkaline phosphatase family protein [Myxococcales bacterium]|nr:alkaline phosphatase family protein [Myxococcales bacterium]